MRYYFPLKFRASTKFTSVGFTLPELLVGVVLGAIVLAALGGSVLISQMRISTRIRTDIERRDALNRAVSLMRTEISAADRVTVNDGTHRNCSPPNLTLEFSKGGKAVICYATKANARLPAPSGMPTDSPWNGVCLLTRSGSVYRPDTGKLDLGSANRASLNTSQIILDNLDSCGSGSLMFTPGQIGAAGTVLRDVDIQIKQRFDAISTLVTRFSARVGSNPLFSPSGGSLVASPTLPVCENDKREINLAGLSGPLGFTPDGGCRNIYNLPNRASSYTITNCTYASCTVNGITLSNVDVLVFSDREIRP